ncbi:MAG TPA: hypothetical protein VLA04_05065 [Verrucomicrobiae bacterium]|nr:hypothetical protein [Verrucomicrobiae bacterium]
MSTLPISANQLATEDIFSILGLQSLTQEEKDIILQKMEQTVLARVYGTILADLHEGEIENFENLHGEDLMRFIAQKGFDIEQMVVEESIRYRMELAMVFQVTTTPNAAPAHA